MKSLEGKMVAIICENGVEEVELTQPRRAFEEAGATVHIISPRDKFIKTWNNDQWSKELPVDKAISKVVPEDYHALLIPGGVLNTDQLRLSADAVEFIRNFIDYNKPIGAISHGAQLLIETGLVIGRELTSADSLKTDIENAGAFWHNEELVTDNCLITCRSKQYLPAFITKMADEIAEENHATIF